MTTAPNLVLFRAEGEKKQKYSAAATARQAHFTPFCFSVDGLVGSEAVCFLKRLAVGLVSLFSFSVSVFSSFALFCYYFFCLPCNSIITSIFCFFVCVTMYVFIADLYVSLYVL